MLCYMCLDYIRALKITIIERMFSVNRGLSATTMSDTRKYVIFEAFS